MKNTPSPQPESAACEEACSDPAPSGAMACPECGTIGPKVALITMKALLKPDALRRLEGEGYHFCPGPGCEVVYFDCSSGSRFRKTDLLVRVGQKESEDPIPICYCFDFTIADLRNELTRRGETRIPETIAEEIRAGHCACEVKNPEGTCCLGKVREAVKQIRSGHR